MLITGTNQNAVKSITEQKNPNQRTKKKKKKKDTLKNYQTPKHRRHLRVYQQPT